MLLSGGSAIIPYTDRFFKKRKSRRRSNTSIPSATRRDRPIHSHGRNWPAPRIFFGEVVGLGLRKHTGMPHRSWILLPNSWRAAANRWVTSGPIWRGRSLHSLIPLCWLGYTQKKTMNLTKRQLDVATDKVNNLTDLTQKLTRGFRHNSAELNGKADQIVSLVHQRFALAGTASGRHNQRVSASNIWIVSPPRRRRLRFWCIACGSSLASRRSHASRGRGRRRRTSSTSPWFGRWQGQ